MVPRLFTASLVAILVGAPVAIAFFNSTMVQSKLGAGNLDISILQGQRITTTWLFFNLFEPLEFTTDFPDDSEACVGHEGCIVRIVKFPNSKSLTVHTIPLDSSNSFESSTLMVLLANYFWADISNSLLINFLCKENVINSIKSDISPIDSDESGFFSEVSTRNSDANISSNFLGIRDFESLGNMMSLHLESNITCEDDLRLSEPDSTEAPSFSWWGADIIIMFVLTLVVTFFARSALGNRRPD
ncbi:uncharacterized protein V1516DRAFT_662339 [Lipomyces oligophaga]|uniref:uncharacterized protein n=1 Tax=Lipomyces oligophaga TaxID=45792 RepID=UPI0034CE8898